MNDNKMTPVLKWAGGKTQLLNPITERMPSTYNRYFEPFIGGAAVLLSIAPSHAFVNDINQQLVNLYCQLKENSSDIIEIVDKLDSRPCDKEF